MLVGIDAVDEVLHALVQIGSPSGGDCRSAAWVVAWALLPGAIAVARQAPAGQTEMVRTLALDHRRVQLVIAPAGAGKTTALRALAHTWTAGADAAARADGAGCRVADQAHSPAPAQGVVDGGVEGEGVGHPGLVDQQ